LVIVTNRNGLPVKSEQGNEKGVSVGLEKSLLVSTHAKCFRHVS
jgi:hypothetical protein